MLHTLQRLLHTTHTMQADGCGAFISACGCQSPLPELPLLLSVFSSGGVDAEGGAAVCFIGRHDSISCEARSSLSSLVSLSECCYSENPESDA